MQPTTLTPPAEHAEPEGAWASIRMALRKWTDALIPVLIGTGATSLFLLMISTGGGQ